MIEEMEQINNWGKSRQLSSPFHGSVVVAHENHVFSVGYILRYGVGITAVLTGKPLSPKVVRELRKELGSQGRLFYRKKEGYLHFIYDKNSKKDKAQSHVDVDNGLAMLSSALRSHGIETRESCIYCGEKGTNYGLEIEPGVVVPAHYHCRVERRGRDFFFMEKFQLSGNYLKGTLGAIFGGFLGAVPGFFLQILTPYHFTLLYALIPMAASVGYQMSKGKSGDLQKTVISIVALVIMLFSFVNTTYFSPYIYQYKLFSQAQMVISGEKPIYQVEKTYPEIREAVGAYQRLFPLGEAKLTIPYFAGQISLGELHGESYASYLSNTFSTKFVRDYDSSLISAVLVTVVGLWITMWLIGVTEKKEKLAFNSIKQPEKPVSFLTLGKHIGEIDETKITPPENSREKISGEHLFVGKPSLEDTEQERPKSHLEIFGDLFSQEDENPIKRDDTRKT